jgi:hypothetical protein
MFQNDPILNNKRSILYYPTIDIPTDAWLRQALLYWDEVQSIVPMHYDGPAIRLSRDLDYLAGEGEFRAIDPQQIFDSPDGYQRFEEFEQELKRIVMTTEFQRRLPPPGQRSFDFMIHTDKVSHSAFNNLLRHGLAQSPRNDQSREWLPFEENTALLYMSLLAKYLGEGVGSVPGTDMPNYQHLILMPLPGEQTTHCFQTNFLNWLPIPGDTVSVQEIVAFKRKRSDELLGFRQEIDEFKSRLRTCQNQNEVQEEVIRFQEKVRKGINDLRNAFSDAKVETQWGTLSTLGIATAAPFVAAGVNALLTYVSGSGQSLDAAATAFIASAPISVSYYWISRRNFQRAAIRESAFSYLYLAQEESIMPK